MTKTLDKTDLVRLAWLTELRRQGHRKCIGEYARLGAVCALGLLLEVAGQTVEWTEDLPGDSTVGVGALAGLSGRQSRIVVSMNDGAPNIDVGYGRYHAHTFAEIADVVEGWFK